MTKRLDDLNLNGLKIYQETDYFCFGIDSVLLANFVNSNSSKNNVVDLCSGSGVIPIIMSAKKKYNKIFGVELQKEMYELLNENIGFNNLNEKIIAINEDVKNISNIQLKIEKLIGNKYVDIVVCNPPYKKQGTGIINENDSTINGNDEAIKQALIARILQQQRTIEEQQTEIDRLKGQKEL